MSQLENALEALQRGFAVFPCWPKTKKPAGEVVPHGVLEATDSEEQVRKWWKINPQFNVGITGGTCIDADVGLNSLEDALRFAKDNFFPPTLLVRTGRRPEFGAQFHFSNQLVNGLYLARGVSGEIRGRGEYAMAPGSIHPSGTVYEIAVDLPRAVADENLLRAFRKKPLSVNAPKPGFKVGAGGRFYWLRSQAGRLVNAGLSGDALFAALKSLNENYCDPPKDEDDVKTLAGDATNKFTANVELPPSQSEDEAKTALKYLDDLLADDRAVMPSLKELADRCVKIEAEELATRKKAICKKMKISVKDLEAAIKAARARVQKNTTASDSSNGMTLERVREELHDLLMTTERERAAQGLPRSIEAASATAENILWNYVTEKAQIFTTESGQGYLLFHDKKDAPIPVTRDGKELNVFLSDLGIHSGAGARNRIGKHLGSMCWQEGVRVEPRITFHFDLGTFTGYFAEQAGKLIRITAGKIERVDNGVDGMLFLLPEKFEPWTLDLENLPAQTDIGPDAFALLPELLFDILEFENESLCREDIEVLLGAYIATLYLPGIVAGKLLLEILGGTGSGKTLFLRMLGRLIYGKQFEVTGLDQKPEQLENAICNNSFLVLDDVKMQTDPQILGMIRRACTGGKVNRRELYSTFGQIVEPYRAAISLTCSEEPFVSSDEMSNRSLIIRVKGRDEYVDENELLQRIDANRDALMAEMMIRLQSCIIAVKAQANFKPRVKMRMASFATFLLRVGRQFDWGVSAEQVLEAWQEEQEGAGLDDSIVETLGLWFQEPRERWANKKFTASELYKELMRVRLNYGLPRPWWQDKDASLVRSMRNAVHAYKRSFGFAFKTRTSGHHAGLYWFGGPTAPETPIEAVQEKMPF